MIKLSDFVAQKLVELGVRHVFMVTGGGSMHLNQSLGRNPKLECVFNHHEQACAMAADSYFRVNNEIAAVNVTSGPGGTNAITGVYGAFVDSVGMFIVSGQVKFETTVRSTRLPLRQFGDQELDIEELVRPITKYVKMVTDPASIRYEIEKAFYLAKSGRPGPVWLDIPSDVQSAQIDPANLEGFNPAELGEPWLRAIPDETYKDILQKIRRAERPVIYAGTGIRISGEVKNFIKLVDKLGIPVVTGFNSHDAIWNDHRCFIGRPGSLGDRAGNFAVQNADLLLILGNRLSVRQVSYNWNYFARSAYKIWVEIDQAELSKPSVKPDKAVHTDLKKFLPGILKFPYASVPKRHVEWLEWCSERRKKFPTVSPDYWTGKPVNPYCFMHTLFSLINDNQVVVCGNGSACVIAFQTANLKPDQRLWTNSGCASMGYDLPAAIGASKALSDSQSIIALAGDGSIMMNLQELQTIASGKLPIKIFILNNQGYLSISQTHRQFFNGVEVGSGPESGVTFPNFKKLSDAFEIPFFVVEVHEELNTIIAKALSVDGPCICEIVLDKGQVFSPKLSAKELTSGKIVSPPLEDLSPFLGKDVLKENMIIPTVDYDSE